LQRLFTAVPPTRKEKRREAKASLFYTAYLLAPSIARWQAFHVPAVEVHRGERDTVYPEYWQMGKSLV
jgi:hypothetical protein